jgi:hypothetical protein
MKGTTPEVTREDSQQAQVTSARAALTDVRRLKMRAQGASNPSYDDIAERILAGTIRPEEGLDEVSAAVEEQKRLREQEPGLYLLIERVELKVEAITRALDNTRERADFLLQELAELYKAIKRETDQPRRGYGMTSLAKAIAPLWQRVDAVEAELYSLTNRRPTEARPDRS